MKELTLFGKKITVKEIAIYLLIVFTVWGSLLTNYYKLNYFSISVMFIVSWLTIYFLALKTLYFLNINKNLIIILSACLASCLALTWLITRHWLLTNILAVAIIVYLLIILPKFSLKTTLIICSGVLFYDLIAVYFTDFMLYATFFAVTDSLPMIIKVPDSLSSGKNIFAYNYIGTADIFIPGLVTLAAFEKRKVPELRMLPAATLVSHALGITLSFWVGYKYNCMQPAMVFIVPCMLMAITLFYLKKGLLLKKRCNNSVIK